MKPKFLSPILLVVFWFVSGTAGAQNRDVQCDFKNTPPGQETCSIAGVPLWTSYTSYNLEKGQLVFLSGRTSKEATTLLISTLGEPTSIERSRNDFWPRTKLSWVTSNGTITLQEPALNSWMPLFLADDHVILSWKTLPFESVKK